MPKISVVVPVYNAEKYLAKCIEHIIHQTHTDLELILVDDGSSDKSPEICKAYAAADSRIKIITQKNSGPANAQNNGLQYITGEYVHIMDNDDWIELDYYEKMLAAGTATGADVLCGEVEEYGFEFPRFDAIQILTTNEEKILITRANRFHPAWRYVYKTEFLNRHNLRF
ncbi:MAG: glycosyltransferase, partial [Rickettsiales bacterium]|nr:glycosyltransferase [Rickettsiales bacterium]